MNKSYGVCPNCLKEYQGAGRQCPFCGFDMGTYECKSHFLEPGTVLQQKYMLGQVMNVDGFGITYLGWDINLATYINVKEYFPENVAYRDLEANAGYTKVAALPGKQEVYDEGLRIYAEEAINMSKFYDMQGISTVKNMIYDNGTAYVIKEYDGPEIKDLTKQVEEPVKETGTERKTGKNNFVPIVIAVVSVIILIAVVIVALASRNKKNNSTTGTDATEASQITTAVTATETNAQQTTELITEAVIEESEPVLPGVWTDMIFMIDDTLYELPMTYEQWTGNGWKTDAKDIVLYSGEIKTVRFYNDKMECSVYLANYTGEETNMENAHVIGMKYFMDDHEVYESGIITLPGDIQVYTKSVTRSSILEDVYAAYGEPSSEIKSEYATQGQYLTDEFDRLVVRGNENGSIYMLLYCTMKTPEGANVQGGSKMKEVPENKAYVAPGYSTDRFDDIFYIDGINYRLGVSVEKFIENGWSLECEKTTLNPNHETTGILKKGESSIEVTISNYSVFNIDVEQGQIWNIRFTRENMKDMDATFPGGLKLGMDAEKFASLYGDMDNMFDSEWRGKREQSVFNFVYTGQIAAEAISVPSETEGDVYYIDEYYYENVHISIDADYSNVDYIQNIVLQ